MKTNPRFTVEKPQTPLLALVAMAVIGAFSSIQGSVLVSTDFDSGYTVGNLDAQSPTNVGLTGNFTASSLATVVSATGTYDLTYNVAGGGTISSGANVLKIASQPSGAATTLFTRSFATAITGQNVYFSYLLKNTDTNYNDNLDFGLTLTADGQNNRGLGVWAPNGGGGKAGYMFGWGTNVGSTALPAGSNLLVVELIWDGSKYATANFWLNPSTTSSDTPDATSNAGSATSLSSINMWSANYTSGAFAIDNITVGTQWSDVVAVPEPTTWVMMVSGLGMLVGCQRFRRSKV